MVQKQPEIKIRVNATDIDMNVMRIGMKEDCIVIEFGTAYEEDGQRVADILTRVKVPPKALMGVVKQLSAAGAWYEKKYSADIGFSKSLQIEGKEKTD